MYDLLLSCPGDAYNECYPAVKNAIDEFKQELLNSQIVDCVDVAITTFWTRFGTQTDKYGSGTEEEIVNVD